MNQSCTGIVDTEDGRMGFLRTPSLEFKRTRDDRFIPPPVMRKFNLRDGAEVVGTCVETPKGVQLSEVETVNGIPAEEWIRRKDFDSLTVVHPSEWMELSPGNESPSMRAVDMIAPIGKGQRALIVAPPKSGKTTLLKQIADAISQNHPESSLIVLLLDERPEEVTDFVRAVRGQVFASSNDRDTATHLRLARLTLNYAKRKVEAGQDVVILLDSLTRLGRAYNIDQKGPGRTLSGGLDARALELPRRVFGAARNIEEGGSLTIVATALIETESRMDDVIFTQFKGTGNCEIVLRTDLAESMIWPAIDIRRSMTRNEELLLGDLTAVHQALRRRLAQMPPKEAMEALLRAINKTPSNRELLEGLKAQVKPAHE